MVDSESSGDEGNMLESFVMNSNILKKGGAGASAKAGGVVFRPVVTPGQQTSGGVYAKSKQQQMHRMGGNTKQLKSLNLSRRGLEQPKKKTIKKKKKKDKQRKTISLTTLKRKMQAQREKRRLASPESEKELEEGKDDGDGTGIYTCHVLGCGKVFQDQSSLRKHAMTHGERQYICPVAGCGKKFLDNSKLKRH